MQELNGQAAVVTGASRGIGLAAAQLLARSGVSVIMAARTTRETEAGAAGIRAAGGAAEAVACDVARYQDVTHAIEQCRQRFGRVDILVNNAGLIDPIARLGDSDPEAWGTVVDVNLKGVYHGLRAALPIMAEQGGGVVVNISSGAATSALEGWSHYCATKAAVLSLTRCVDLEYRAKGIRVVGLSPGTVATGMQRSIKASGINPVSRLDWEDHISPEWAARAVAYLCTAAAADLAGTDFSLKSEEGRRRVGLV
ncbi:SDR family oxidoreductase [Thalassobaculum sp.]|uniref:SDR family oxidoreductase n=1 Tax=Thalassobaculum sp. TaxID=2022740 RepID=UPI0032EF2A99